MSKFPIISGHFGNVCLVLRMLVNDPCQARCHGTPVLLIAPFQPAPGINFLVAFHVELSYMYCPFFVSKHFMRTLLASCSGSFFVFGRW